MFDIVVEEPRAYAEKVRPNVEMGTDGDNVYDWQEQGGPDINPALSGSAKYEVYREMTLTDPAVRSTELMFMLPIRGAQWGVEPASDDGIDLLVADAVRAQFGLGPELDAWLDMTWDESITQALLYLRNGAQWEEIVWGDPILWTPPEGGEEMRLFPIDRLSPRHPATIRDINAVGRRVISIEQERVFKVDGKPPQPIPGNKLVHYIADQAESGWWGTSLLRPMWGAWKLKKQLQTAAGIGWDRFAVGIPKVRRPLGGGDADEQRAQNIGRGLRLHERAWVVLEGAESDGWDVEIMSGAQTLADPVPLLRHFDEQIALAGLQGFTRLGVTETGSRAVGEVLADPYYVSVQAIAKYVAAQRQKHVVRRFVDVNFGPEFKLPEITVEKITRRSPEQVIAAVSDLSAIGFNLKYEEMVEYLLESLGLPDLPDDHPLMLEEGAPLPKPPGGDGDGNEEPEEEPPPDE